METADLGDPPARLHVLVTGGAGFIGSHVVDLLAARGHRVRVLDRLHPKAHGGPPSYLRDEVDYRWGDLNDHDALGEAVEGVDAVCHQASMVGLGRDLGDVVDYVRDNDLGTAALLAALHRRGGVPRLVLGSSMVVYGEGAYRCRTDGPVRPPARPAERLAAGSWEPPCPRCDRDLEPVAVTEDAPVDPRSVYAATKLAQEHLAAAAAGAGGPAVTALRYLKTTFSPSEVWPATSWLRLKRDHDAVRNGLRLPYSSGAVEGTINASRCSSGRCMAARTSTYSASASCSGPDPGPWQSRGVHQMPEHAWSLELAPGLDQRGRVAPGHDVGTSEQMGRIVTLPALGAERGRRRR